MSNINIDPKTYHSGENNNTTGREPFEDTSRDFIHGNNAGSAAGTGIPGTFGAGVGGTGVGHSTGGVGHSTGGIGHSTTGTHGTHGVLTGATAGATGAGLTGRHGRRGSNSSSSSSSSDEEVNGVRQKKTVRTKNKKPIGEKVKEAVGMGGAAAATHGSHEGASHGVTSLHGQRDAYNETTGTRGDINTGTSRDPAVSHSAGLGGLSGATRQTGDAPGGIQSGNTHFGTGHNLASEARDHTTGSHHTGTGIGSGVGATSGLGASSGAHYGSNTAASDYSSNTTGLGQSHTSGLGQGQSHTSGLGHSNVGEDRSAGYARTQGGPGNEGITGNNLSGAAGTDRFDVDRSSSGAYGHNDANKHIDSGVTRTGGDFTNSATATGGAYSNPDAKTGLTGREHTTTGVPDQHGHATEQHTGHATGEQHSGGILDKVKGMLGGHKEHGA
ncbi:hypothetical protein QFC24_005657 [Naganishia onofrii]|uniref:Uncharacterized protein n=1 Tax=Naganishia onofrii TaxID=1851511 RepID=A0ACC2X5W4_9TREE|nr:hypothetical protein QFC24_005657 [Naganishia onofrii]